MGKSAGFWVLLCIAVIGCLGNAACTGTPTLFNQVTLTPKGPITLGSGGAQLITAGVLNDSSGAGVTWASPAHGTLSGETTTSVTYNAPVVAPGTSVSDTVKATSVTFPSQIATLSITVEGAPVISTASLPAGNEGTPYSQTVSASGGVAPYSWSISSGSLPAGLSPSASTTTSVMISGTPTAQGTANFTIKITDSAGDFGTQALSITIGAPLPLMVTTTNLPDGILNASYPSTTLQATGGIPPFSWTLQSAASTFPTGLTLNPDGSITGTPTAAGTFNFTVQVTDSETPAMKANANLSITVSSANLLNGNYVFLFSGFNANGAVVIGGSFTADGKGNLTNGVEDFNSALMNSYQNRTFTGTYTLGADGRGVLTFSSLQGPPAFAFAIDASGSYGRMVEFDSSGIRGSGQIQMRSVSTCTANTLNGQYAFGITGQVVASILSSAGPAVIVGSFGATPSGNNTTPGSISNTEDDANSPGNVITQNVGWGGSFQTTSQNTRCTMNISPSVAPTGGLNYSVYPISANELFVVETDQVNSNEPFLTVGKLLFQTGYPFFNGPGSTFTGTSIAGLTGQVLSGGSYLPDLALVSLTGSGSANYTIFATENEAGTVIGYPSAGATFSNADAFGRLDSGIASPIAPVFYVVGENEAFCIGEILNNPFFGLFEPQSTGPFTASALNGSFEMGTATPAGSPVRDLSGSVTLANTSTTAGTVSGTQDQSASGGNTTAAITGTYSGLDSSTGAGTIAFTAPATFSGQFLVVSPTKIVVISTTAGDADPILLFVGNCVNTCGEN